MAGPSLSRIIRRAFSWSAVRFAPAVALAFLAGSLPGWLKGPAWLAVFAFGAWGFFALTREMRATLDRLLPRAGKWWQALARWSQRRKGAWRLVNALCITALAILIVRQGWPIWKFMASASLREDEIMNVATYTSQGFVPAVSTYSLARNHIFFNVLNALLPGADSTFPFRARFLSFAAAIAMLAVFLVYAGRRGWFLAGLACAGLLATNAGLLKILLEARGYGLIACFAMIACLAFTEWLRGGRGLWLGVLAATCVLGAYTLPFYLVFGGGLLLLAFLWRPSRESLLAGLCSLAAVLLLYLPVAAAVWRVTSRYQENYESQLGSNFAGGEAVFRALEFFFPPDAVVTNEITVILLAAIFVVFAGWNRWGAAGDRRAAAGILAVLLGFLAFCFLQKSPPVRIAAFTAAPLAFLATTILGSALAARTLLPLRPLPQLVLTFLAATAILRIDTSNDLIPQQDWRTLGAAIDRVLPKDLRVWVAGRYQRLLEWNLNPRREAEKGPLDRAALAEGKLAAVEGFFKLGDREKRMTWSDLPKEVRFFTMPLLVNYQRIFFVPSPGRGIASLAVGGRPLPPHAEGRQPYDPLTLARSRGHGDALYPEDDWRMQLPGGTSDVATLARPEEISLPATIEVEFAPDLPIGSCNLLFSQTLADKEVSAEIRDPAGRWREAEVFRVGELASIALPREACRAARIHVKSNPAFQPLVRPPADTTRPTFGLLEAWTTPN